MERCLIGERSQIDWRGWEEGSGMREDDDLSDDSAPAPAPAPSLFRPFLPFVFLFDYARSNH